MGDIWSQEGDWTNPLPVMIKAETSAQARFRLAGLPLQTSNWSSMKQTQVLSSTDKTARGVASMLLSLAAAIYVRA